MILDRPLDNSWFVSEGDQALKLSKLLLGMYANNLISTKSMYPDKRPSSPSSMDDFESLPRSRRSTTPDVQDSIHLAMAHQAHRDKVKERLNKILLFNFTVAGDSEPTVPYKDSHQFLNSSRAGFEDLFHFFDPPTTPEITTWKRECPECLDAHDARSFDNLFDVETWDDSNATFLNPKYLGFDDIPEMKKRKQVTDTLPAGNDFIDRSW